MSEDIDLCGVCGASWECEHRPDIRVIKAVPDPFGPDVARVVDIRPPAMNLSTPAFREAVLDVIRRRPGVGPSEIQKALRIPVVSTDRGQTRDKGRDRITAALRWLRDHRRVTLAGWHSWILFDLRRELANLQHDVEMQEYTVKYRQRDYEAALRQLARLRQRLQKLETSDQNQGGLAL